MIPAAEELLVVPFLSSSPANIYFPAFYGPAMTTKSRA